MLAKKNISIEARTSPRQIIGPGHKGKIIIFVLSHLTIELH